ncbi:dihydroorotate dehydrogenase B catalytic subunit [Candidatus Wirthbacteria bacterium CG2_30_54_11]|uniref:Dihydroorotate dehydrogenase n=1 Tax=Candidatus Wirthbacteria bacterium CG2_30_54_11 TaxID=1817892 RepID=A0A1J5IV63_9BACT|nr:MAG: dihydroorotate dehydrogenase B catalytic subunit [Candidatus Wirthbacteria bacterium CG2_30_54_11]
MADLSVNLCGIKLRNPTILASGVLGVSGDTMKRVYDIGAGAITLKSITNEARKGHPGPVMLATDHYFMNAVGLSGQGVEGVKDEVKILKDAGVPVIASVFAASFEECGDIAARFESYGVDAIELNISCPNLSAGEKFGVTIGTSCDLTAQNTAAVKKKTSIPLIVKLSPNVTDIVPIAKAAVDAGADMIAAVNTFGPGLKIDIEAARPVLSNKLGGVSGPGILPLALAIIWRLRQAIEVPIIAMGGITKYEDVIEMMMAGADAVAIGTGVYYSGIAIFRELNIGLSDWLDSHGYQSISEIKGLAQKA